MIYLDNAGTTKINQMVVAEMFPYITDLYGNPGSIHDLGLEARHAVEIARERVAKSINAEPEEIIFTSGGSEANSFMVRSALAKLAYQGKHDAVSSKTEHESMIQALKDNAFYLELLQYYYPVDCCQEIAKRGASGCSLVSMMYVNNELGFVNPVYEIGKMKDRYGFIFITDCVQALGGEYIDVKRMNCDMMSISSHKIHGPKGVGAVYIKKEFKEYAAPVIYGGSNQEFGLRGGTENVPGIVGFGKACELINVEENKTTILSLRKAFLDSLKREFLHKNLEFRVNFDENESKIVSLTFKNVDAETLVLLLSARGVYISAGSACKSLEQTPNEVLLASGFTESDARSTVRISLSCYNTKEELEDAAKIIGECVSLLVNGC